MHAHATVRGGTIEAQKYSIGHRCPRGACIGAVETSRVGTHLGQLAEGLVAFSGGNTDLVLPGGGQVAAAVEGRECV